MEREEKEDRYVGMDIITPRTTVRLVGDLAIILGEDRVGDEVLSIPETPNRTTKDW